MNCGTVLPARPHQLKLCGDLLVGKLWRTGALRRVLDCNGANVAFGIHVENGVLIEIAGLGNWRIHKLDE